MVSIPISDSGTGISFNSVRYPSPYGSSVADILRVVRCCFDANNEVHLDPDLRKASRKRWSEEWRPIFGQCSTAQAHLDKQHVDIGDLFLFYGYFKALDREFQQRERFNEGHVVFGWLQIAERLPVNVATRAAIPWALDHPHLLTPLPQRVKPERNTVYTANEFLSFLPSVNGGGVFPKYHPDLCLTEDPSGSSVRRSIWHTFLDGRTGQRQEQVKYIECEAEAELKDWLHRIFRLTKASGS
jgi:hypothetical protein